MHVWTDGEVHVVATGRGVAWTGAGGTVVHRFEGGATRRGDEPRDVDGLAASGADRVVVVRGGAASVLTRREGEVHARALKGPTLQAITALDGERVLVAFEGAGEAGRTQTRLSTATLDGDELRLGAVIELPPPSRLPWPDGAIWEKSRAPWPEDDDDPDQDNPFVPEALGMGAADRVRFAVTPHGVVVTGNYAGTVALLDRTTLAPRWAVRTPTQDDAAIHAVAARGGVLVVIAVGGRESGILLLDPGDGSRLAHRVKMGRDAALGLSAPVLVDEEHALVTDSKSAWTIALPGLEATRAKVPEGGRAVLASAPFGVTNGALVAVGNPLAAPEQAVLARVTGAGAKDYATMPMPDLRPKERVVSRVVPSGPSRRRGTASLGLNARGATWRVGAGAELGIELVAVNQGGEASGMYVELGGPAVASGLVVPSRVRIGGAEATFEAKEASYRADVTAARLDAAFEPPPAKQTVHREPLPPPPRVDVSVVLRGAKVGNGLLTVRLGTIAAGPTGSALQGRNVEVVSA